MNESIQKYYWIVYQMESYNLRMRSQTADTYSMAINCNPISWIIQENSIDNSAYHPTGFPRALFHSRGKTTLISWQEINFDEYELARQNILANQPPDPKSENPYR